MKPWSGDPNHPKLRQKHMNSSTPEIFGCRVSICRLPLELTVNHAWRYVNMKSSKKTIPAVALLAVGLALSGPMPVAAQELNEPIAACLKAWGDHPFGKNPQYKTLGPSVKLFGIGTSIGDAGRTSSPALILVNPIFNVMGESTIELSNPNGWYCLRTTVSVLGRVNIRANCKAQLAETSDGNTMLANSRGNRAMKDLNVTVVGSVSIERPCT